MQTLRKRKRDIEEAEAEVEVEVKKAKIEMKEMLDFKTTDTYGDTSEHVQSAQSAQLAQSVHLIQPMQPVQPTRPQYNQCVKNFLLPFIINDLIPIVLEYARTIQFEFLCNWNIQSALTCSASQMRDPSHFFTLERDEIILISTVLSTNGLGHAYRICCFQLETGKYLRSLNMVRYLSEMVDMTSDGKNIFIAELPSMLHVWDLDTLQLVNQWNVFDSTKGGGRIINSIAVEHMHNRKSQHRISGKISGEVSNWIGNRIDSCDEIFVSFKDWCGGEIASFSKKNGSFNRTIHNYRTKTTSGELVSAKHMCVYDGNLFASRFGEHWIQTINLNNTMQAHVPMNLTNPLYGPHCMDVHGAFVYVLSERRHIGVYERDTGTCVKIYGNANSIYFHDKDFQLLQLEDVLLRLKISHDHKLVVRSLDSFSVFI